MEDIIRQLRDGGWRVGVHNDYRLNGEDHTFWLWTHQSGLFVKGEGKTDIDALRQVATEASRILPVATSQG
jgi:hypothetical protein